MDYFQKLKVLNLTIDYPRENNYASSIEEAIHACLNPPLDAIETGQAIALPNGSFDIKFVLEQLPPNWEPDLISISSSLVFAKNPPLPKGLENVKCSTAMKLTDSHHTHRPIQKLIEFSKSVGCQYHWTTYNRQHVHFYREAGLQNVFWMPGSINVRPWMVKPASDTPKKYEFLFLGNSSNSHPYRSRLLSFLKNSNINISIKQLPFEDSMYAYAESEIVFNCSLNGDLNRRVYETLMAGGFLLTDRLSPEAGLSVLFKEGEHFDAYGSENELLEKAKYYLNNPREARSIARNGHDKLMSCYTPEILREQFYGYVVEGKSIPDIFLVNEDSRCQALISPHKETNTSLVDRIKVYELFQAIHRLNPYLKILHYYGENQVIASDLKDLPRIQIISTNSFDGLLQQTEEFHILAVDAPAPQDSLNYLLHKAEHFVTKFDLIILIGKLRKDYKIQTKLKKLKVIPATLQESGDEIYLVYRKTFSTNQKITSLQLPFEDNDGIMKKIARKIKFFVKHLTKK